MTGVVSTNGFGLKSEESSLELLRELAQLRVKTLRMKGFRRKNVDERVMSE